MTQTDNQHDANSLSMDYKDKLVDAITSDNYIPNMKMDDFVDAILAFFNIRVQPTNKDFDEFIRFVRCGLGWSQFDFELNDINWENVENSNISKDVILKLLTDIYKNLFNEQASGAYCALGRLGFIKDWKDGCIGDCL